MSAEAAERGPLERAGRLAGWAVAQAIARVSRGGPLAPFVASEGAAGRATTDYAGEDPQVGVALAKRRLADNPGGAGAAVSIFDGFVTLAGKRHDALVIDAIAYDAGRAAVQIILPYRPPSDGVPFAVHRPKFAIHRTFGGDVRTFADGFRAGADDHPEGKAIWDAARDETI